MGGGNTKQKKLTQYELTEFTNQTNLTYQQVENLHAFYKSISASEKDDGVIDMQEFSNSLQLTNQEFSEHVFNIFDLNKDKVINFREFILGLANLMGEKVEYKTRFAFNLMNKNKNKEITDEQIYEYMKSLIRQFPGIQIDDSILKQMITEQVKKISSTFKPDQEELKQSKTNPEEQKVNNQNDNNNQKQNQQLEQKNIDAQDNASQMSVTQEIDEDIKSRSLTYSQFKQFVTQNPHMLKWLQLDINNINVGANKLLGKK